MQRKLFKINYLSNNEINSNKIKSGATKDDLQEWRVGEDWCLQGLNGGVLYNFQHVHIEWFNERPWDKWFQNSDINAPHPILD
jgi:hypothetical protein